MALVLSCTTSFLELFRTKDLKDPEDFKDTFRAVLSVLGVLGVLGRGSPEKPWG